MTSLFRREAIEHRQGQWLGNIQLVRPVTITVLTGTALASAVLVAAYLGLGEYTRKARVSGYLVPDSGIVRLVPPQAAVVLERRASEGQSVRRGDVLFVLSVDRATLDGDTEASVKASLTARERSLQGAAHQRLRLLDEQRHAADRRIDGMRRELSQIDAEAELQRQRLALAQSAHSRLESLLRDNFISEAQIQTKTEELLALQAELQGLQRRRAAHLRELDSLQAELRELPIRSQVQQGEIDRDLAALAQEAAESEARRRIVVRAPQDGVISAVLAEPGQSVNTSVALASMVPAEARLQAHLYAPSNAVGFVRADQAVALRYDAFPYQKFGHQLGKVVQVSRTPLQTSELADLPLPGVLTGTALGIGGEPLYRITVRLDRQTVSAYGEPQPLTAGMQLQADVMLERRRLIEWIFEPLLGVAGRL